MPKYKFTKKELETMRSNEWFTERERRVFDMYYRKGKRIEDIAAEEDIARSTVNRTLKSIREKSMIQK